MELKIKTIIIKERSRTDFGKIQDLSDSIKKCGLINPILVEYIEDHPILIAGERRIRASILAGLDSIEVTTRENLSGIQRKELELHENLYRKEFEWTEEVALKAQLHELKIAEHGPAMQGSKAGNQIGWSLQQTADSLEESKSTISMDIQLAGFLVDNPNLKEILKSVPKTVAFRKMKQLKESEVLQERLAVGDIVISNDIRLGSFETLMKELPDNSVDMILTDPPYGTDAVVLGKSKQTLMEGDDNMDSKSVNDLLWTLLQLSFKKLKEGRHMYLFFSLEFYKTIIDYADLLGFKYNRFPIIWHKDKPMTAGTGLNYTRTYEPVMFLYKPAKDASNTRSLRNHKRDMVTVKPLESTDRIHAFQKPLELLKFFIDQSSEEGETILDPFVGSGATIRAAKEINRSGLGFELNEDHYKRAQVLLNDSV